MHPYDDLDDKDKDDGNDDMEYGHENSAVIDVDDNDETGEDEAKARWNGSTVLEGVDDDDDSGKKGEDAYKMPAHSRGDKTYWNLYAYWQMDL